MMIRERRGAHKNTVLLIRVFWDKERKRSAQKVLGSFEGYLSELPDNLIGPESPLTTEEKAEAQAWLDARKASRKLAILPGAGLSLTRQADEFAAALENPETVQVALQRLDHLALYNALDRVTKALRKQSLTRPPRKKSEEVPSEEAESESFGSESLTLDQAAPQD